jgi:hypothetical protein
VATGVCSIRADLTNITAPDEQRMVHVAFESREVVVPAEDRSYTVPASQEVTVPLTPERLTDLELM